MAKKNLEELSTLQEAITQIKKIKAETHGNNPRLFQELDLAEHRLLDEFFDKTRQIPGGQKTKHFK